SFDGEVTSPIAGSEYLMGGDRLVYTGNIESILKLRETHGLALATNQLFTMNGGNPKLRILQSIVPINSKLIGYSFSQTDFEKKYNLTLVAISREGKCVNESPRAVIILPGDLLLLECSESFQTYATDSIKEVVFINKEENNQVADKKAIYSSLIMLAVVLSTALGLLTLLEAVLIGVFGMIFTRCCTVNEGQQNINWDVIIIFGCSLSLGTALQNTGVANFLALSLLNMVGDSPLMVLAIIYLSSAILTEFVSNTAASALVFPISYGSAIALGVNPMPFIMSTMIACSSSFSTPIGSSTNIMIYNPGGYLFIDFLKIGPIITLVIMTVTLILAPILWPF
ncbi:MAG: SLC13 family permease, partial [Phocaeicola sp.]